MRKVSLVTFYALRFVNPFAASSKLLKTLYFLILSGQSV
jgi:hypothetical protein